ncbi:hypothetical protein Poly51_51830 [Rubripirellula tenax]|uniref:Uncharacterized protein n=1 Tax=Rubripirellula tenax TaxID=2528015 RepID=A0A5C6EC72_9BACT|nr:hypothetical protein [Rubripirellula tenax]TWU47383.1 hypothetical protein Poly51_51830 [Rubripirellula tenax]
MFDSPEDRKPILSVGRIFADALRGSMLVWVAMTCVICVLEAFYAPGWIEPTLTVSLASGIITIASLLPGLMLKSPAATRTSHAAEVSPDLAQTQQTTHLFIIGAAAAMAIRFAGTVALFVACRYQSSLPATTAAIFVCGWYILLTATEIALLARGASGIDLTHGQRHDSGDTPYQAFQTLHSPSTESTLG